MVDYHTIMSLILSCCKCIIFRQGCFCDRWWSSGLLSYSWRITAFGHSSTSVSWTHDGQQMPFSITGSLHPTGGHDSTKHVTWESWGVIDENRLNTNITLNLSNMSSTTKNSQRTILCQGGFSVKMSTMCLNLGIQCNVSKISTT